MSIYATLWRLQFPRFGDDHVGCDWVEVLAQGVPGHIGTPSPGHGYEAGDPYAEFLPPPIVLAPDDRGDRLRAVVIVRGGTPKDGQRYTDPLLVLTGEEYERGPLRGGGPRPPARRRPLPGRAGLSRPRHAAHRRRMGARVEAGDGGGGVPRPQWHAGAVARHPETVAGRLPLRGRADRPVGHPDPALGGLRAVGEDVDLQGSDRLQGGRELPRPASTPTRSRPPATC